MNNPYILLRILLAIDIGMCTLGVFIPVFKDYGLIEMIYDIGKHNDLELVNHLLWLSSFAFLLSSWIGILLVKRWGRTLYLVPMVFIVAMSFIRGNSGYGGGIFAVMQEFVNVYYGFFIAMLYFGPVASLFDKKSA